MATESVELSGSATAPDGEINSGLFAQTVGPGDAGNLSVETGQLIVGNGAEVRVNATDIMGGGMSGAAGNLEIQAGSIRLDSGQITARTISGKGGNIQLQARDLLLLRRNMQFLPQPSRRLPLRRLARRCCWNRAEGRSLYRAGQFQPAAEVLAQGRRKCANRGGTPSTKLWRSAISPWLIKNSDICPLLERRAPPASTS